MMEIVGRTSQESVGKKIYDFFIKLLKNKNHSIVKDLLVKGLKIAKRVDEEKKEDNSLIIFEKTPSEQKTGRVDHSLPARRQAKPSRAKRGLFMPEESSIYQNTEREVDEKKHHEIHLQTLSWRDVMERPENRRGMKIKLQVQESCPFIVSLIQEGRKELAQIAGKDAVFILGTTGSGKSTTTNFLVGHKIVRQAVEGCITDVFVVEGKDDDIDGLPVAGIGFGGS
ncbi:MAG: hypothetical protein HRT90_02390, partial [Candidatus Margulisbacteria bacterium]|nr:hypothetical protein [Candidatus Margulisiibacteriota bacterium]